MKKPLVVLLCCLLVLSTQARDYTLTSPNGEIEVHVSVGNQITYSINYNGAPVLSPSVIAMHFDNGVEAGDHSIVGKALTREINEMLSPVIHYNNATIPNHAKELELQFREGFSLTFRAYDDGVAYRFSTTFKGPVKVLAEDANFCFATDHHVYFPEEESMYSHNERLYLDVNLSDITEQRFCSTPTVIDAGIVRVLISESGLYDYPGMFLQGGPQGSDCLQGKFAPYPQKTEQTSDRDVKVTEYANYLAQTDGTRSYPWRLMIIANTDAQLASSEMVYKLASPQKLDDTSWIKPGKVSWDWWNALNVYGVDFKSGVNTATYKYYIDFAAKYGLPYIILDEGWYDLKDLMKVVPDVDMDELTAYGKEKGVGLILWTTWKALDDKMDEAMDQFAKWGIKGIKVDFMQRNDQVMIDYYYRVAEEAAKRKLLVDFHGAHKPAGLSRVYPNVIGFEGVKGMENAKWSDEPDPEHDLRLAFIRNVVGPMDYTPGAMINKTKEDFRPVNNEPASLGTRCHQLAEYVVFQAPLQMLCDNPSNYYREPECMQFLEAVPTTWDETKVLDGKVSDYIITARRSGKDWYIGAMTDWTPRDLNVDLSFLPPGNYKITIWKDGVNADRYASDYKMETQTVKSGDKLKLSLAPGGGWAAIVSPI